jgi:hypothetical protein
MAKRRRPLLSYTEKYSLLKESNAFYTHGLNNNPIKRRGKEEAR